MKREKKITFANPNDLNPIYSPSFRKIGQS